MRFFLFTLLFFNTLFSAELLKYNVYERETRFDIMLSFGTKFDSKISQESNGNTIRVKLHNATYSSKVSKTYSNALIKTLQIIPSSDMLEIVLDNDQPFNVSASKTIDGYGLRIRVTNSQTPPEELTSPAVPQTQAQPEDKPKVSPYQDVDYSSYYIVMGGLVIIIIGLFSFKKWFENRDNSWLKKSGGDDVIIHFQKQIDLKTKVVMIEYEGMKYLTLVGESNTVIDKFPSLGSTPTKKPMSDFDKEMRMGEEKFNSILKATKKMRE